MSIDKIRAYIEYKLSHQSGAKRSEVRGKLREMESEFFNKIPDKYEIDGYVLKKMTNQFGNYISLFTKDSWNNQRTFSDKSKLYKE